MECADKLREAGKEEEAALLSVVKPPVALQDSCDYRCGWARRPPVPQLLSAGQQQPKGCGTRGT